MAVPRNLKWYDTIAAIFVLLIISPPVALGQPTGTGGAVATTPRWQPLHDAAAMRIGGDAHTTPSTPRRRRRRS